MVLDSVAQKEHLENADECPFCGSGDVVFEAPDNRWWRVMCRRCSGRGPRQQNIKAAVQSWNGNHKSKKKGGA